MPRGTVFGCTVGASFDRPSALWQGHRIRRRDTHRLDVNVRVKAVEVDVKSTTMTASKVGQSASSSVNVDQSTTTAVKVDESATTAMEVATAQLIPFDWVF